MALDLTRIKSHGNRETFNLREVQKRAVETEMRGQWIGLGAPKKQFIHS